jgi:hypothetical protein
MKGSNRMKLTAETVTTSDASDYGCSVEYPILPLYTFSFLDVLSDRLIKSAAIGSPPCS